MPAEIIDLTNSPPSPPSSFEAPTILHFGATTAEQIQFERAPITLMTSANPNLFHNRHQQTNWWLAPGSTFEPSQIISKFQPNTHSHHRVSVVREPLPKSKTFLFPNGTWSKESWTPTEHELLLMGLIKYGKGRWNKIAKHFLLNKTPQQVQTYAESFFRRLPPTYLNGFKRRDPTVTNSGANKQMTRNKNLMAASATSFSNAMVVNNEVRQTRMLFPEKVPFSSNREVNTSSSITTYGFQMQASVASSSMTTASASGEVDLELRLGQCY